MISYFYSLLYYLLYLYLYLVSFVADIALDYEIEVNFSIGYVTCTFLQRSVNPHSRTLALPCYNRLQPTPNFYSLDKVSFIVVVKARSILIVGLVLVDLADCSLLIHQVAY